MQNAGCCEEPNLMERSFEFIVACRPSLRPHGRILGMQIEVEEQCLRLLVVNSKIERDFAAMSRWLSYNQRPEQGLSMRHLSIYLQVYVICDGGNVDVSGKVMRKTGIERESRVPNQSWSKLSSFGVRRIT